jgi:Arc/MetJ-type ribon-helix-helix transcriptional regulator
MPPGKAAYKKGVTISVNISPIAAEMIDVLLKTGLYGMSRSACCREFIYRALRDHDTRKLAEDK